MMLLVNLAYLEWITIDCNRKFYIDLVCMAKNKNLSNSDVSYNVALLKYCSERYILKNSSCFNFIYFMEQSISEVKRHQIQHCITMKTMKKFQFLISAVNTFPNILSIQKGRITVFLNIRYHNIIKFYVVSYTSEKTRGYFIKKTNANIFSNITLYDNMYQCNKGRIIGSQHVCDEVFDCGRGDLSDEKECVCKTLEESKNKRCKHIHKNGNHCVRSFLFFGLLNIKCITWRTIVSYEKSMESENKIECQNKRTIQHSLKDDLVPDCGESSDDESQLQNIYIYSKVYPCPKMHQIPCRNGHSKCFEFKDICVYRLNKYKHLIPCRTGEHM